MRWASFSATHRRSPTTTGGEPWQASATCHCWLSSAGTAHAALPLRRASWRYMGQSAEVASGGWPVASGCPKAGPRSSWASVAGLAGAAGSADMAR